MSKIVTPALKIGLTGGIGSGKTTVSEVFKKLGVPVFNSDDFGKKLLQHNTNISFEVIDNINRPVSVTADHSEFRNIVKVDIISSKKYTSKILLDSKHSMEERILNEQFVS